LRPASLFSCSNLKCWDQRGRDAHEHVWVLRRHLLQRLLAVRCPSIKKVRQKLSLSLLRLPFGRPDPPLFPVRQASDVCRLGAPDSRRARYRAGPTPRRIRLGPRGVSRVHLDRARDGQQSSSAWATWAAKDMIDTARRYEACSCRQTIRADDRSGRRGVNQATPRSGPVVPARLKSLP